jgi:NAD(P)-dependent dehydrogenase (short-subunit alcohol dehydrogenase family)
VFSSSYSGAYFRDSSILLLSNKINPETVVVSAKTTSDASKTSPFPPDPNSSQSTINTVEREIKEAGGDAIAIPVDTRDPEAIDKLVRETVRVYGKLDVLVYNSGAIWWSSVENTPVKRFQLMQQVNPGGLYASVQAVLPHFKQNGWKGRIIVVSPPIYSRFFRGKTAYAIGELMRGARLVPASFISILLSDVADVTIHYL